jgi:hypothetical protein
LEGHLREEIERQVKQGTSGQLAFKMAVQIVGEPAVIHEEFKRADGVKELLLRATKDHADLGLLIAMTFIVVMTTQIASVYFSPTEVIIANDVNHPTLTALYMEFASGRWGNAAVGNISVWLESICLAEVALMCLILRFAAARQTSSFANHLSRRKHTARFGQLVLGLESLFIVIMPQDPFWGLAWALITSAIFVFLLRKPAHVSERESAIS